MSVEYKVYGCVFLEVENESFHSDVSSVLIPLTVSLLPTVFLIPRAPGPPSLLHAHGTGCPCENAGSWVPHTACIGISRSRCSGKAVWKCFSGIVVYISVWAPVSFRGALWFAVAYIQHTNQIGKPQNPNVLYRN